MHRLGVSENWQFHDCFGLDEELLGNMILYEYSVFFFFFFFFLNFLKESNYDRSGFKPY